MLQRRQSVYLLGAFLLHALLFLFPLWHASQIMSGKEVAEANLLVYTLEVVGPDAGNYATADSTYYIAALTVINLLIILGLGAIIFMYGRRPRQLTAARLMMVLQIILLIVAVLFTFQLERIFASVGYDTSYYIGIFLIPIAIACTFMATRGITADERLVRSAERLR